MSNRYSAFIRPAAPAEEVAANALRAIRSGHCAAVVMAMHVMATVSALRDTGAATIVLVNYPFGASKAVVKAIEATSSLKDGAAGAWIVPRWPKGVIESSDPLRDELLEIARAVRATRREAQLGLIIDSSWMKNGDASVAIRAAREGAADALIVLGDPSFSVDISGLSLISGGNGGVQSASTNSERDTVAGLNSLVSHSG